MKFDMLSCVIWYQMFAPSRGRELKYEEVYDDEEEEEVRPLAGAGIEIVPCVVDRIEQDVRPLAGAGIEILTNKELTQKVHGSPPRGGGN